jgi:hypothetical protein
MSNKTGPLRRSNRKQGRQENSTQEVSKPTGSARRRRTGKRSTFADPWRFRRGFIEPAAGADGRPLKRATVRHNGKLIHAGGFPEPLISEPVGPPERSMLTELRRRRSKQIAEYRLSGLFSEEDMSLIEAILNGQSLTKWGECRTIPVTRQAASDRLGRLKNRAPFVWGAWRRMNRMRGR